MAPARKKVKKESSVAPDPATSSSSRIPDPVASVSSNAAVSSSSNDGTKLFEFKFTSMETEHFDDNEVNGRFHLPLLVDEHSGVLSLPQGIRNVRGFMEWKLSSGKVAVDEFIGKVIPKQDGDHDKHVLRFGYLVKVDDDDQATGLQQVDRKEVEDVSDISEFHEGELLSETAMEDFASEVGGELEFSSLNILDKSLSLYTVISELRPGQVLEDIKLQARVKKPNWDRLATRAENYPPLEDFYTKAALIEYKRFLALKIMEKDQSSERFAPSPQVDKVWHLHLTFPEEYQQDVLAFAKELKVRSLGHEPLVISHCPFLMEESKSRYESTLENIGLDKYRDAVGGAKVDLDFWPPVDEIWSSEEENEPGSGFGCC